MAAIGRITVDQSAPSETELQGLSLFDFERLTELVSAHLRQINRQISTSQGRLVEPLQHSQRAFYGDDHVFTNNSCRSHRHIEARNKLARNQRRFFAVAYSFFDIAVEDLVFNGKGIPQKVNR